MLTDIVYEKNWNDPKLIEIVIPTFNRVDNLIFLIKHLLKNTNTHFCISIIDNDPEGNLLTDFIEFENINHIPIRVLKNKLHLGPDASVLRALEIGNSEWIYLLGDSKIPCRNALDLMVNDINNNNGIASIVYKYKNSNKSPRILNKVDQLSSNDLHWGDFFLGGNSILHKDTVRSYFSIATQFTLTRSMLLIFHILALKDKKNILISENILIDRFIDKPNFYNPGLSLLECWAQFPLLTNLPIRNKDRKMLLGKILDGENFEDKIIFYKFCLIKIFRENSDISFNLRMIMAYRNSLSIISIEKISMSCLYFLSKINYFFRGKKYEK